MRLLKRDQLLLLNGFKRQNIRRCDEHHVLYRCTGVSGVIHRVLILLSLPSPTTSSRGRNGGAFDPDRKYSSCKTQSHRCLRKRLHDNSPPTADYSLGANRPKFLSSDSYCFSSLIVSKLRGVSLALCLPGKKLEYAVVILRRTMPTIPEFGPD